MCGIVGGTGFSGGIVPYLVSGLKALEYRGYDSAGLAVEHEGDIRRFRALGRVANLEALVSTTDLTASATGIAHTRWATHGVPAERNAHPHVSECGRLSVAVVHNGIIENHAELRTELAENGYVFTSDTDTEVIAHLLHRYLNAGVSLEEALRRTRLRLRGLYAIAAMEAGHPRTIVATRQGAPLLLGIADHGHFLASDVSALLSETNRVVYLEDGDLAILSPDSWRVTSATGEPAPRHITVSALSREAIELGDYPHYMLKEIHEQPGALANTLEMAVSAAHLPELFGPGAREILARTQNVLILACGTSAHAGLVARHWIEELAGVPCSVEIASEYRYRKPAVSPNTLVVTVSQSGETADTRAALEYAVSLGMSDTLSICNVPESALTRMSRLRFLTRAGPEIGVASTKAFTTQLIALRLLALALGTARSSVTAETAQHHLVALRHAPAAVTAALSCEGLTWEWAVRLAERQSVIFLGRGVLHPIAMEGALKLKEITYIHAEAYSAGELKHGPLALIDENMPVIVSVANDELLEKVKANIEEVLARSGEVFVVCEPGCAVPAHPKVHVLELPERLSPEVGALVHVLLLQCLSYHTAIVRGTDVDKPRNLAKSVTVE